MKLEVVSGWNYTDYDAFLAGQAYPYDADALYAVIDYKMAAVILWAIQTKK
ncbi:MAG: hypothetical protein ACLTE2_06345 [Eubacteriales bacterium]